MLSRRQFFKLSGATGIGLALGSRLGPWVPRAFAQFGGGTLDPTTITKYDLDLVKPPAMPSLGRSKRRGGKNPEYYEIAMWEFDQQILPGKPPTTVWSYGPANDLRSVADGGNFFYPAFTLETTWNKPVQVKWINQLGGKQHLLPVDPSLHWANPIGRRDTRPNPTDDPDYWDHPYIGADGRYTGPVPMVVHVHGAHTTEESDGYAEAWWLPKGPADPNLTATTGTFFDYFAAKYGLGLDQGWGDGAATFTYPNNQRATTLWYHDHTLGMTRVNVYAGPAGFYLIRGGPDGSVAGFLPGPAPVVGDNPFGTYYEIPIAIQDRAFNDDGSLFYPDHRYFFEDLDDPAQLQIPFTGDKDGWGYGCGDPAGLSDVAKIWQPEYFGNVMVVNGRAWPRLEVEQRRYRFRLLNGCNSRFLILDFGLLTNVEVWQIGAEGGFLPAPIRLNDYPYPGSPTGAVTLLMAPAERADIIVDFTNVPVGQYELLNKGPDEPFGGGAIGTDFAAADPATTGQVMRFDVVAATSPDPSTPPGQLRLPPIKDVGQVDLTRQVSLNEEESRTVLVSEDAEGNIVLNCDSTEPFGPTAALLGTLNPDGTGNPLPWMDAVTENPAQGATETWEIHNFTADAHPIHIHLVQFQVIGREAFGGGPSVAGTNAPLPWETGFKDTVIAYPGEITRVKMQFDYAGFYVWHCHIVEHEDNEMMRPYVVGPQDPNAPHPHM